MGRNKRGRGMATAQVRAVVPASQVPASVIAQSIPDQPVESKSVPSNPDTITLDRDVYNEERKLLIDLEKSAADQHDESILKLASGALALTITFLDKIATNPKPDSAWLIRSAWIFLLICIFLMLLSFLTSQWASSRQRRILDNLFQQKPESERNVFARITAWLNPISYIAFVAGIGFSAAFAWVNFNPGSQNTQGATQVANQKQPQKPIVRPHDTAVPHKDVKGGYVPPSAPVTPSGTKKDIPPTKDK